MPLVFPPGACGSWRDIYTKMTKGKERMSGNEILENVIRKFENQIKKDTLANEILYNTDAEYTQTSINGENLKIAVKVIK